MEDPNITMEDYIKLEEEKSHRHSKVYDWETATYGRIWYDDDVRGLRSVQTEFPAIFFNDELTFEKALSCKPTVSSLNSNKIDYRISFDESDDEDYTEAEQRVRQLEEEKRVLTTHLAQSVQKDNGGSFQPFSHCRMVGGAGVDWKEEDLNFHTLPFEELMKIIPDVPSAAAETVVEDVESIDPFVPASSIQADTEA
ncbi:hypothetical protein Tco_1078818 [Tanacetum coccineum]|uniref:Uncharacterized protein n=1 Tax=Tanacetum coccineum TaxID=301880 RepID=A0ABQ5HQ32_9ASTR